MIIVLHVHTIVFNHNQVDIYLATCVIIYYMMYHSKMVAVAIMASPCDNHKLCTCLPQWSHEYTNSCLLYHKYITYNAY